MLRSEMDPKGSNCWGLSAGSTARLQVLSRKGVGVELISVSSIVSAANQSFHSLTYIPRILEPGRTFNGHALEPLHCTDEEVETLSYDFLHSRIHSELNLKSESSRSIQPFPFLFLHSNDIQVSIYLAAPAGTAFSWGPRK